MALHAGFVLTVVVLEMGKGAKDFVFGYCYSALRWRNLNSVDGCERGRSALLRGYYIGRVGVEFVMRWERVRGAGGPQRDGRIPISERAEVVVIVGFRS